MPNRGRARDQTKEPASVAFDAGYGVGRGLGRDEDHPHDAEVGHLRDDICARLSREPSIDMSDVEVGVSDAEVTLTGSVPSEEMRARVVELTRAVPGVNGVHSELTVQGV